MVSLGFCGNGRPSLGVELELQLLDARSLSLRPSIVEVLAAVPQPLKDWVRPEFHQCCVEVTSGVGETVDEIEVDLSAKLAQISRTAQDLGLGLGWGGTHPFDHWRRQPVTMDERYLRIADTYRETICRQLTFGLHVHVGVPDGDAAIRACDSLRHRLPVLLALSANSPFWCGRPTGLQSHRIEIMGAAPQGGVPPAFGGWAHYCNAIEQLLDAGAIDSPKDLWWDIRPSPSIGTVEVRICDMPPDLEQTLAIVALVQCLVHAAAAGKFSDPRGTLADIVLQQNRWRAARHGLDAILLDPEGGEPATARRRLCEMANEMGPIAEEVGCTDRLRRAAVMAWQPTAADRQLACYRRTGSAREVVRCCLIPPASQMDEPAIELGIDASLFCPPTLAG